MANPGKFFSYLVRGQFGRIGSALVERLPLWLYRRTRAFIFVAPAVRPSELPELPHGYHCRPAVESDLPALSRLIGFPVSEYERRFNHGDLCYAVFEGDRPANLNWIHFGSCFVRGAGFSLHAEPGDAYIYGIYTGPSERGKGLYKKALVHLADHLAENGARRLVQMVEDGNAPVLHTLPKLGYTVTTTISHLCLFGLKVTKCRDERDGSISCQVFVRSPGKLFEI